MDTTDKVEGLRLVGSMTATLRKADGTAQVTRKDNIIVDVGFDYIADAIGDGGSRPAVMGYIAIGTGTTAADAGDTTLETEAFRETAVYAHTTSTKVFTLSATIGAGDGTGAITEAGVLNAASTGILLDRVVFSVINKAAGDSLDVVFTFTMS